MPPSSLHSSSVLFSHPTNNQKSPSCSLASSKALLSSLQALHNFVTGTPLSSAIAIGLFIALPGTLTGVLATKMLKHYIHQRTSVRTTTDDGANSDHSSSAPCTPVLSTPASPLFEDTDSSTDDHKLERQDSHHELIRLVPAAAFDFHHHSDDNDTLQLEVEHLQEALYQQQLQHQFEKSVLGQNLRVCQSQNKQHQSRQEDDEAQLHALRYDYDTINDNHTAVGEELELSSERQEHLKSAIDSVEQRSMIMDDELLAQQHIIEVLQEELVIAQDDLECARADLANVVTPDATQSEFELAYLESRAELLACQENNEREQIAMEVELRLCQKKNEHMQQSMAKVSAELKTRKGDRQQIIDLQKSNHDLQKSNEVLQESCDFVNEQFRLRVLDEYSAVKRLQAENEVQAVAIDRLDQLITRRENEHAQIDKRKADYIAVMEEERVKTSKEIRELKKLDSARLGELQTLRALKQSLQKQLGDATKDQPQAQQAEAKQDATISELQRKVDDAMHKWQDTSNKCSALEMELEGAHTELTTSQQRLDELTGSLSHADIERQSLTIQVQELTTNLSHVDLERQSLTAQLKELTADLSQADAERQSLTTQLNEAQEDLHNARSARNDIARQKELAEQAFSVKEAAYQAEVSRRDEALFYADEDLAIKEVAHQKEIAQRDHALVEAQRKVTEESNRCMTLEAQLRALKRTNKRQGISEQHHKEALQRAEDAANAAAQREIALYRERTRRADHNSSIWASLLAQGIGIPKHVFDNMSDDSLNELCIRVKMQDEENFRLMERIRALEAGVQVSGPVRAAYGGFHWVVGPPPPPDYRLEEAVAAGAIMQRTSSRGSARSADSTFAEVLDAGGDIQEAVRETLSRQVSAGSGHTVIGNAGELEHAITDDEGLYAEDGVPIGRPPVLRRASWG